MDNNFPPQSSRGREIEAILSAFSSVIEGRCAYYVSTPMTTGRSSADLHCSAGKGRDAPAGLHRHEAEAIHDAAHAQAGAADAARRA